MQLQGMQRCIPSDFGSLEHYLLLPLSSSQEVGRDTRQRWAPPPPLNLQAEVARAAAEERTKAVAAVASRGNSEYTKHQRCRFESCATDVAVTVSRAARTMSHARADWVLADTCIVTASDANMF